MNRYKMPYWLNTWAVQQNSHEHSASEGPNKNKKSSNGPAENPERHTHKYAISVYTILRFFQVCSSEAFALPWVPYFALTVVLFGIH
jgi:hypothetical protein